MLNVTVSVFDAHVDLIATAQTTPDPPGLHSERWNLVDRVTGTTIPVQALTLP